MAKRQTSRRKASPSPANPKRKAGTKLFLVVPCKNVGYGGLKRQGTVFSAKLDDVAHLVAQRAIVEVKSFADAHTEYRKLAEVVFRKEFNMASDTMLDYEKSGCQYQYGDASGGPDVQQDAPSKDDPNDEEDGVSG